MVDIIVCFALYILFVVACFFAIFYVAVCFARGASSDDYSSGLSVEIPRETKEKGQ